MNRSFALAVLVARRFLSPTGVLLLAGALALALVLPWSPSALRGAGELSADVNAGLARQGVWLCAVAIALSWFAARAGQCVRQWRHGEGDWLGTASLSRWSVVLAHALGAALALALALAPFAVAGEVRAGSSTPPLRWLADSAVPRLALTSESDRAELIVDPPPGASAVIARFVIAAPGDGGPSATVRCTVKRAGSEPFSSETRVANNAPLLVALEPAAGQLSLTFERVGAGAVAVLEGPRLQWFAPRPARWSVALSLFLHAWLAGSAATAIAFCVAAWTSAGTAFLSAFVVLAFAWLEEDAPRAWPGVGLRDALELTGSALAPAYPGLSTWLACAVLIVGAPLLTAMHRDLWRREV